MATNFPTSLDSFTDPLATDQLSSGVGHHGQHGNANDAIAALEAKVGVNSSAVTTSLDYKIAHAAHSQLLPGPTMTTMDKFWATTSANGTSGATIWTQFVSTASFTSTKITLYVTTTDATANVTSAYLSLYTLDASGNGTQVAVTPTTTSMFNALGANTINWASSVAIVAGAAMAVGFTFSVSAGSPAIAGAASTVLLTNGPQQTNANAALWTVGRAIVTPPPATFTKASLTFAGFNPYYFEIA